MQMRSSLSNQYPHSYNSPNMNHRSDRPHHSNTNRYPNSHSHNHSNYNPQHSSYQSHQHSNRSRTHTTHSQYNRSNHSPRRNTHSSSNHNHRHVNSSLHSNPNQPRDNHRTHNNPSHTRTHHHQNYNTSHLHPSHNRHRHDNRDINHRNSHSAHHRQPDNRRQHTRYNNNSHPQVQRSRHIKNLKTTHNPSPSRNLNKHFQSQPHNKKLSVDSIAPPILSIDDSIETANNNKNTNRNHKHLQKQKDTLANAMTELSFDTIAYKFDYKSKINFSFEAAKQGKNRCDFQMDCTKITPWKYTNEMEQKTKVRTYMLPCLKLLNKIQCMDEAIDFIYPPNDQASNPDYFIDFMDNKKTDTVMCFQWIENLLKSDYYETVDDFANDVRLIFNNCYKLFGYKHPWSKNARTIQTVFETKMINISRHIPNAKDIFTANGNPDCDSLQTQFLQLNENKQQIQQSLKLLENSKPKHNPIVIGCNEKKSNQMDVEDTASTHSNSVEVISKKSAHQKYLSNIDTSKIYRSRKRAPKQTLKRDPSFSALPQIKNNSINIDIECEEGEIPTALDAKKLDMCDVWFEFIRRFNDSENLRRVVMIQEQMANTFEFNKYKKGLENRGSELQINISDKAPEIQCKIYEVLQNAKNRITRKTTDSLRILDDMIKQREERMKLQMEAEAEQKLQAAQRKKKAMQSIDPYSNKAVEERRKREEEKKRLEMIELEKQRQKMDVMEEDSDDFNDDLWLDMNEHGSHGSHGHGKQDIVKVTNNNFDDVILGKDSYESGSYRPIRPGNLHDVDIGMEENGIKMNGNMERQTSDNEKYKEFAWENQQGGDDIDF